MGTVSAKGIIDQASLDLYDETQARYSPMELLRWLNDGARQTVLLVPDANAANVVIPMVSGSRQSIPPGGFTFLYAVCNMELSAGDFTTYGTTAEAQKQDFLQKNATGARAVRDAKRTVIDRRKPHWHQTPSAYEEVLHFVYDTRNKRHFYVYPARPSPLTRQDFLEIVYSLVPPEIPQEVPGDEDSGPAASVTIELEDIYATALHYYIMHRAFAKEDDRQDMDKSQIYYRLFESGLGVSDEQSAVLNPRQEAERAEPT